VPVARRAPRASPRIDAAVALRCPQLLMSNYALNPSLRMCLLVTTTRCSNFDIDAFKGSTGPESPRREEAASFDGLLWAPEPMAAHPDTSGLAINRRNTSSCEPIRTCDADEELRARTAGVMEC